MKLKIVGVSENVDGEWELDDELDYGAFRTIKQTTGLRASEVNDALAAGDADLVVAFAMIALDQNGRRYQANELWRAKIGSITLVGDLANPTQTPNGSELEPNEPTSGTAGNGNGDASPETDPSNDSGRQALASLSPDSPQKVWGS